MAITLQEAKVGMADHVDQQVIETIQRNSKLMDALVFDNAVSPSGAGSTLVYGYIRLKTAASAAGREIGAEYTAQEAKREEKTTKLVIMGGSYQIDRVLAESDGAIDEVEFQSNQKIKSTIGRYQYLFINGNSSSGTEFDGLSKLLTGTDSVIKGDSLDLQVMDATKAEATCEALDEAIAGMDGQPTFILGNIKAINKLKAAARLMGYLTRSEDAFGKTADGYNGIPFLDLGKYYNGSATVDIIPVTKGKTDIYLVRLGLDGVCGVSLKGDKLVSTHLPDFTEAKAVHTGDVEFVASMALKNTRAAAVIKGVTVAAPGM